MGMVGISDIQRAAARLAGVAARTPLLESAALNEACGRRVFIKPENLQRTGSFKFRGAYNRLSQLDEAARRAGVVAWSSGNHGQGVAAAARLLGVRASVVMPGDAPGVKIDNTRAHGAEVIFYDRYTEDREAIARDLCAARGATLIPSYDDPGIIAGQGTVGLEIREDVGRLGARLDAVLVCCGGGGLVAGTATAIKDADPATAVYAVEPEGYDDYARSLASGRRETADASRPSICDALLAPAPGKLTFPINRQLLAGGLVVAEDEVIEAMRYAFRTLKLVVEPGGAVALAALLAGKCDRAHETLAVVLSGGNVDPAFYAGVLSED